MARRIEAIVGIFVFIVGRQVAHELREGMLQRAGTDRDQADEIKTLQCATTLERFYALELLFGKVLPESQNAQGYVQQRADECC